MTLEQLVSFIGWMLLLNILLLTIGFLKITIFKKIVKKILNTVISDHSNKLYLEIPRALVYYKILIIIFNLVPYVALQIMLFYY